MMGDLKYKIIKMEDVVPEVVDGPEVVKAVSKRLQEAVPTASRSNRLSAAALLKGLGPDEMVSALKEMLNATVLVRTAVFDEDDNYVCHKMVELPDWKARSFALKELREIHGYTFTQEKAGEEGVPNYVKLVYNDFRKQSEGKEALNPAELMKKYGVGDVEAVDEESVD